LFLLFLQLTPISSQNIGRAFVLANQNAANFRFGKNNARNELVFPMLDHDDDPAREFCLIKTPLSSAGKDFLFCISTTIPTMYSNFEH